VGLGSDLEWHPLTHLEAKSISAYSRGERVLQSRRRRIAGRYHTHVNYDYHHRQFSRSFNSNGSALEDRLKFSTGVYYFVETGSDPLLVTFPSTFATLYIDKDHGRQQ